MKAFIIIGAMLVGGSICSTATGAALRYIQPAARGVLTLKQVMLKNGTVINYDGKPFNIELASKISAQEADKLLHMHGTDSLSTIKLLFTGKSDSLAYEDELDVQHGTLPNRVLDTIHWNVSERALSEYAKAWFGTHGPREPNYQLLFTAAAIGAVDIAWFLLSFHHNISVNQQSEEGDTPLHAAAANNHQLIVDLLLRGGADVNAKNRYGYTPLMLAARAGHVKVVSRLLTEQDVEIDAVDNRYKRSALHWATTDSKNTVISVLVEAGADITTRTSFYSSTHEYSHANPLHVAAAIGNTVAINSLLSSEEISDYTGYINEASYKGTTPLMLAAKNNHWHAVNLLLEKGAELDVRNHSDFTALILAAGHGNIEVVELLLDKGADMYVNMDGEEWKWTVLDWAISERQDDVAQLLISRGIDVVRVLNWVKEKQRDDSYDRIVDFIKKTGGRVVID